MPLTAAHYRLRQREARIAASLARDLELRRLLVDISTEYEALVKIEEERARSPEEVPSPAVAQGRR
jgi:hypothetical protein